MPAGTTNRDRGRRWLPPIFFLTLNLLFGLQAQAANGLPLGRTASPYIGSVMALLATFEDAGVLPPEGTPDANRIIKATIQFQSAFLKSRHPAVQQFFSTAQRNKFGARAEEVEASFRQAGWSGDSFRPSSKPGRPPKPGPVTTWRMDFMNSTSARRISRCWPGSIATASPSSPRRGAPFKTSMRSGAGKCLASSQNENLERSSSKEARWQRKRTS